MKHTGEQVEIALRLQKGDLSALELLYQKFHSELYFYALKITTNRSMAEDAVQDTFVAIWNYRSELGSVRSLQFYLIRSVRHQCLKLLKNKRRFRVLKTITEEINISIEPEELKLTDYSQEVKDKVARALQQLTARQREIIYLKFYENLDYREIAELLSLNYQSVINHVHRAILKLRKSDALKYLDYS